MAALGQAIFRILTADAGVAALVRRRVYPLILPQNPQFPAIRYTRITSEQPHSTQGPLNHTGPRVQIDSCAPEYADAEALARAVRTCLDGYRGLGIDDLMLQGVFFSTERDLFEPEPLPGYCVIASDYFFWHTEPT